LVFYQIAQRIATAQRKNPEAKASGFENAQIEKSALGELLAR
jgi:hypothetical protein